MNPTKALNPAPSPPTGGFSGLARQEWLWLGMLGLCMVAGVAALPWKLVALIACGVAGLSALAWFDWKALSRFALPLMVVFLTLQPYVKKHLFSKVGYGDEGLALLVLGGLLLASLLSQRNYWSSPLTGALVAYGGISLLSAVLNGVPIHVVALGLLAVGKGMSAYFIGYHLWLRRTEIDWFYFFLLCIGGLMAGFAALQFLKPDLFVQIFRVSLVDVRSSGRRIMGLFAHPKELAQYGMMIACLFLGRFGVQQRWVSWATLGISAGLTMVILSKAKMAFLALVAVFLVYGVLKRRAWVPPAFLLGVLAVGIGSFAVGNIPLPRTISYKLQGLANGLEGFRTGEFEGNFSWRAYTIYKTQQVVRDHPVLGVGPGRWGGYTAKLTDSPEYDQYDIYPWIIRSLDGLDVDWLRTIGEGGFILVTIFLLTLLFLVRQSAFAFRYLEAPNQRGFALGLTLFSVFVLMESLTSQLFESAFVSFYFWSFHGMVAAWLWRDLPGRLHAA